MAKSEDINHLHATNHVTITSSSNTQYIV